MKKKLHEIRRICCAAAFGFIAIGAVLLAWMYWPVSHQTNTLDVSEYNRTIQDETLSNPPQIRQPIILTWDLPTRMHAGQVGPVHLKLSIPAEADSSTGEDVFTSYRVYLVSRIDSDSLPIAPRGEMTTEITPGDPIDLVWSSKPVTDGKYQGNAWVYFRFVPRDGGKTLDQPVVSRPFSVRVSKFTQIHPEIIRWSGFGLFAAGCLGVILIRKWMNGK
jgi:hypothetical protein